MQTVELNIPDAAIRARRSVIRSILAAFTSREFNLDQTVQAIEHLIIVEADEALKRCNLSNKAEA